MTAWIIRQGFLLYGALFCLAGILAVIWFNLWRTRRSKHPIPISYSHQSHPHSSLSEANKAKQRLSKIDRLTTLIKEIEAKIPVKQAKGEYFNALPGFGESVAGLLKKKDQYIKELEKLK